MTPLVLAHHAISPAERFRDALAVASIALLLGIPMIGLTTVDQGGALRIASRWPTLFAFVAACFAGRLLLRFAFDHWRSSRTTATSSIPRRRC
jgi:branched-chain amino acid transport system permease protein